MLNLITVHPDRIKNIPSEVGEQTPFFNLWISVLRDAVDNCIILIPSDLTFDPVRYMDALESWPIKYKKRAQELLAHLKKANRFQRNKILHHCSVPCADPSCSDFLKISTLNSDCYYFLENDSCLDCASTCFDVSRCVHLKDYQLSLFSSIRKSSMSYNFENGEWVMDDFEKKIFNPVFAYAKNIKLYDRYVGRSMVKWDFYGFVVSINKQYQANIEWIVQLFKDNGGDTRGGIFEIYCGIEEKASECWPSTWKSDVKKEIKKLEQHLFRHTNINVNIILKEETSAGRCPHGRYLVTDQISLVVDRGFDLLWSNQEMREKGKVPYHCMRPIHDGSVVVCSDCNAVENQISGLSNL